ncbi:hypothetical protein LHEJCM1006_04620 [Lactobacillus helveticus]|nr:hypothetical protein LHEJCM1006_04620 [Lactobacillus helveticus]GIP67639.1 hypothetical protein LhelvAHU1049_18440 [Lactobacillus helveticus]
MSRARSWAISPQKVADLREENQLHRVYKEVDPSAGEFDEYPHRFYATFETENESDATAGPPGPDSWRWPPQAGEQYR